MTAIAQRSDLRGGVLSIVSGLLVPFASFAWVRTQRVAPIATYTSGIAKEQAEQAVLTVQEMIRGMRDGGLPVSAIAEMACVERKTVYSWLDGIQAKADRVQRVEELYGVLSNAGVPFEGLWRVWERSLSSGTSLRTLLTSKDLDCSAILAASAELKPVVKRHASRAALRRTPAAGSRNPVLDEMPVADFSKGAA